MPLYNIRDAKTKLSQLAERAARGEEIVIARSGRPLARLVPLAGRRQRKLGLGNGLIRIGENFDDPLPPDILEAFEGKRA
jgi:prevent-host-death family protein